MLSRRIPWTSQPPAGVGVDWANPLTKNLTVAVVPGNPYNLAARTNLVSSGISIGTGLQGTEWVGQAGANYVDCGGTFGPQAGTSGVTVLQLLKPGSSIDCQSMSNASAVGAAGLGIVVGPGSIAGDVYFRVTDNSGSNFPTGPISGLNDGKWHTVIGRWTPGALIQTWVDRYDKLQEYAGGPSTYTPSQNLMLHRRGTTYYPGRSGLFLHWNRLVTTGEISRLLANPWQVFQP